MQRYHLYAVFNSFLQRRSYKMSGWILGGFSPKFVYFYNVLSAIFMMEHTRNISIGKDQFIEWIDFDPTETATNIDEILQPTEMFWLLLETECVAECCGIDAFSFWKEDIMKAKINAKDNEIINKLILAKEKIINFENNIIRSSLLNSVLSKITFINLLNHIIYCLKNDS